MGRIEQRVDKRSSDRFRLSGPFTSPWGSTLVAGAGVDVGKSDHHTVAVTTTGQTVFDKALPNDEARLCSILQDLAAVHGLVLMVVDQPTTIGAPPVALAEATEDVAVAYPPGLAMRFDRGPAPGEREDRRPGCVDHRRGGSDHAAHSARHPGR